MERTPRERAADAGRLRAVALTGAVALLLVLPLAAASAGQLLGGGADRPEVAAPAAAPTPPDPSPVPSAEPRAAGCGPELTSPEGVEAQTCVLREGGATWARTYYRNTTGAPLTAVLSFMGPAARTVQLHCEVRADDEPALCETPREPVAGPPARYTAVAEFAEAEGGAARPLLLRSGSAPAG
ncbi:hypothetical protein [Streptomyces sp. NPDC060194]|uniref:hypothetical protein n=1 Tax=Streptomyces sp. NPDC060194 TaxID=3347069 RepID=UPI003650666D